MCSWPVRVNAQCDYPGMVEFHWTLEIYAYLILDLVILCAGMYIVRYVPVHPVRMCHCVNIQAWWKFTGPSKSMHVPFLIM